MDINLNVPGISGRVLAEVETRPAKVEKWLAELPLLNIADTARRLMSTLTVYNRIELPPEQRLELLELYRYPLNQIALELQKQYMGQPLPLPDKTKSVAEQDRQFHIEMAFGYKWVVLGLTKQLPSQGEVPDALPLAIQRAIHYLSGALVVSYESYAPHPLGVWHEIHTLYRHAEALGVQDAESPDRCNVALQKSSAALAYKQALLLDLADPYHIPARHVDKIYKYLDRWASLAVLYPAPGSFDPTCQFLIDLSGDRAGIAYTAETVVENAACYRLLNTVELARKVHDHLTLLRQGQTPDPDGLDPAFFNDADPVLRRLLNVWGLHPKRVFRRSARLDAELEMAIGLDAANYWLNGGSKFMVSSTFVGPMPKRSLVGPNENKTLAIRSEDLEFSTWEVLDESAGGLAIGKNGVIKTRVRVGDLVAMRSPGGENDWSVAAIRWIQSATPSSVEAGVQRLAPTAEAVVFKTVSDKNIESDFMPALLLPEIRALKQLPTLITHGGVYRPGRVLYMDNGFRLHKIEAGRLIEATTNFERFEFQIVSA